MRDYARVAPTFWTRGSGKALRGHPDAQVVALYLLTAPGANMIGLYHVAMPTIAHETGLPLDRATVAMERVCQVGIAMYDPEEELVFLPEGARYQIGEQLKPSDRRVRGIEASLGHFGRHPFALEFAKRYQAEFCLAAPPDFKNEGGSDPLRRFKTVPSKPGTGTGTESGAGSETKVGFETAPPSGAGPSPDSATGHEPLAGDPADAAPSCDLASAPAGPLEAPATASARPLEPPCAPPDAPEPVPPPARPALAPADLRADPPAREPATAPASEGAPRPAPSRPAQVALPLNLPPGDPREKFDPVAAIFAEYVTAWKRSIGGRRAPTLDDKRRRKTQARLREFSEDDLKAAARGIFLSEWNVEAKQISYDLVVRDAEHVEKFMLCDEQSRARSTASAKRVPEWLSEAARPSPRVVAALRESPGIATSTADPLDVSAMLPDLSGLGVIDE